MPTPSFEEHEYEQDAILKLILKDIKERFPHIRGVQSSFNMVPTPYWRGEGDAPLEFTGVTIKFEVF